MGKPFHTAHRWDLEWQDDVDVLSLRGGVQVKVFYSDPEIGVADMLIKFRRAMSSPGTRTRAAIRSWCWKASRS